MRLRWIGMGAACVALALGGCGDSHVGPPRPSESKELRDDVKRATQVSPGDFPSAAGRTLQELTEKLRPGPQAALAGQTFTPGRNRLAFGLLDQQNKFLYGPTVVYVGARPSARAHGPYPAPADVLVTDPPYRSRQAASEEDPFAAVYAAQVPFTRPGRQYVLIVSNVDGVRVGATARVRVIPRSRDPVVAVGQRAPAIATDTVASAGGDERAVETRVPPDDMHDTSLKDVLGRKPVALLFATPALCQSRVCGPVVDIAVQLERTYGDRVAFIHQEVYVDNEVSKGLRPPLRSFGLRTEPWLFTIKRDGTVAARLEGSFGFGAFEDALKAAL